MAAFIKTRFWGLQVQAGKEYKAVVERSFAISGAALVRDLPANGSRTSISVAIEGKKFTICSLTPHVIEQQALDLSVLEGTELTLVNLGDCDVDLTGNYTVLEGLEEEDPQSVPGSSDDEGSEGSDDQSMWQDVEGEEIVSDAEETEKPAPVQLAKRKLTEATSPVASKKSKPTSVVPEKSSTTKKIAVAALSSTAKSASTTPASVSQATTLVLPQKQRKASTKSLQASSVVPAPATVPKTPVKIAQVRAPPLSAKAVAKLAAMENPPPSVKMDAASLPPTPKPVNKVLPNGLAVMDVVVGSGTRAKNGKEIGVRFVGRFEDDTIFDERKGGQPLRFKLGAGDAIRGWDLGLQGMKVGGTRRLKVPPTLAYGSRGRGSVIPPDSTLFFEVKLVEVK
ncbi:hypothetical protein HKX48_004875 [Thoreauomyces humboldtii]|nr:hypothetical protein HKX48_004875 [Thoreauomyces humboldtii]